MRTTVRTEIRGEGVKARGDQSGTRGGRCKIHVVGSELAYRTKPMEWELAERCQRMLENNPRFAGATIEPAIGRSVSQSVGRLFCVAFVPSSVVRQQAMHEAFQSPRTLRAQEAQWWELDHLGGVDIVRSAKLDEGTGEITFSEYETSDSACTCPDWKHRCSKIGARCKHQEWRSSHLALLASQSRNLYEQPQGLQKTDGYQKTDDRRPAQRMGYDDRPTTDRHGRTETQVCIVCGGCGERLAWERCASCEGRCEVQTVVDYDRFKNPVWDWRACSACEGQGGAEEVFPCGHCEGTGYVEVSL